jgi:hypothetical protein
MGGSESTLAGLEGYQIVRVINNSPAHVGGLVAFFDFITAVDKLSLDRDNPSFFFDYVRRNQDKAVTLQVFNLRVRASRDVTVVPSNSWGGVGLLGVNVCWESAEAALESTWHIVDVAPDSPAYRADLMSHRDYILGMQPATDGTTITTFRDGSDFHGRVEEWRARMAVANRSASRTLLIMIFDSVDNAVKEVLLDMSSSNSIGVDVANGYLHVVPPTPNSDKLPVMKRFVVTAAPKHESPHRPEDVLGRDAPQHNANGHDGHHHPPPAMAHSADLGHPVQPHHHSGDSTAVSPRGADVHHPPAVTQDLSFPAPPAATQAHHDTTPAKQTMGAAHQAPALPATTAPPPVSSASVPTAVAPPVAYTAYAAPSPFPTAPNPAAGSSTFPISSGSPFPAPPRYGAPAGAYAAPAFPLPPTPQ